MDSIEEAADTNVQIRDNINKRLETLSTEFEFHNDNFSHKSRSLTSRLEGLFQNAYSLSITTIPYSQIKRPRR